MTASLPARAARAAAASVLVAALGACGPAVSAPTSPPASTPFASPTSAISSAVPPTSSTPPLATPTPKASGIPLARVPVLAASSLAAVPGAVWVVGGSDVTRVDTATGTTRDLPIDTGGDNLDSIAATPTAVWAGDFTGSQVFRVDPESGRVTARVDTGSPVDIAVTSDAVWVSNHHQGTLTRLDPRTGRPVGTSVVGPAASGGPQGLALGDGSLWVDISNTSEVVRVDPRNGAVLARIAVPAPAVPCGGILVTSTAVWVTSCGEAPVLERIDPVTNRAVATIQLAGFAVSPLEISGSLWLPERDAQGGDGHLEPINPATNSVDRTVDLPVASMRDSTAVVANGQLWVSDGQDEVLRIPLDAFAGG